MNLSARKSSCQDTKMVGMSNNRRAVAYLRISEDKSGEQFGIATQRERTTKLIEARGWTLAGEYVDNSVSASKARGKGTAWHDMLTAAERGAFDVIVAVDLDRLLRQTADLARLIETGAKVVTVDGEIDLSTADGEFRATMLAGIARFEVRRKSERTVRANQRRREQGIPLRTLKVLGYTPDGMRVVEEEAEAIRAAYRDFLSGVTLRRISHDLNSLGYTTSKQRPWSTHSVRGMLANPRNAGLILHHETGDLYPSNAPAIVSMDMWRAVQEKLSDPSRRTAPGMQPRWLLSGLARCGRCGSTNIRVGKTTTGVPAYRCNDHAHLSRKAEPIDEFVNELIVARLSEPDAADLFADDAGGSVDRDALREERLSVESRMEGLAALFAEGALSAESVRSSSAVLRGRLNEIDSELAGADDSSLVSDVAEADDVKAAWWGLGIERRRLILDALMVVTIRPVGRGRTVFSPESVGVEWKV